jgi:hypothetical protein
VEPRARLTPPERASSLAPPRPRRRRLVVQARVRVRAKPTKMKAKGKPNLKVIAKQVSVSATPSTSSAQE